MDLSLLYLILGFDAGLALFVWWCAFMLGLGGDDRGHGKPSAMSPRASENYRTRD